LRVIIRIPIEKINEIKYENELKQKGKVTSFNCGEILKKMNLLYLFYRINSINDPSIDN
jgi:hypothetical protein